MRDPPFDSLFDLLFACLIVALVMSVPICLMVMNKPRDKPAECTQPFALALVDSMREHPDLWDSSRMIDGVAGPKGIYVERNMRSSRLEVRMSGGAVLTYPDDISLACNDAVANMLNARQATQQAKWAAVEAQRRAAEKAQMVTVLEEKKPS